jgi:hypothetical protein
MLWLYRALLYAYPLAYRCEYGEEMMAVFVEAQENIRDKGIVAWARFEAREAAGLLYGAFKQHVRSLVVSCHGGAFLPRRLTMRSEFRFPKATVTLMVIILAAVLMAIDKAQTIQASVAHASQQRGDSFTVLPTLLLALAGSCLAGLIGWVALFALRRSGVQRLSGVDASSAGPRPSGRLGV